MPEGKRATLARRPLPFPSVMCLTQECFCLAASGRQARLRQAAAGAPASLRRTRWRGFGLSLRSDA
ncbi:hypothetical protein [Escherichia coli]|uniref:hypothetical protein n=1 Tax=Escherichia coli TaxID=562 RepID=UPI0032EF5645